MLVAQFDALLAILEPHIKKKTTDFCELCARIFTVLCAARRSGWTWQSTFWFLAFRIVKTPLKMLATDAKNAENRTRSEFFYDGRKFQRQCVNVTDTTWGRIYFSTCKNFGLSVQWPLVSREILIIPNFWPLVCVWYQYIVHP